MNFGREEMGPGARERETLNVKNSLHRSASQATINIQERSAEPGPAGAMLPLLRRRNSVPGRDPPAPRQQNPTTTVGTKLSLGGRSHNSLLSLQQEPGWFHSLLSHSSSMKGPETAQTPSAGKQNLLRTNLPRVYCSRWLCWGCSHTAHVCSSEWGNYLHEAPSATRSEPCNGKKHTFVCTGFLHGFFSWCFMWFQPSLVLFSLQGLSQPLSHRHLCVCLWCSCCLS
ncbi:uncharacterized protein LOC120496180 isoform X2 [Passer montanus]|uniref:uncharacterized protein LOC120496180 isoform X2 n=1 Tax=Passer montanus TaxID=9160 RepID=UPI00195F7545|nr:uncharacterized protein LOC120496180 isoform X2 [Passer montanus]